MNETKWILFIGIIILLAGLIYIAYRLNDELNKPVPPDGRCGNCRTTIRDMWHEIRCTNKKSAVRGCMVDDFHQCRLWKGKRVRKCRK